MAKGYTLVMAENSKTKALKAIQVAMDLESRTAKSIKIQAVLEDLTPQDYMRKILGLSYKSPKRPRLSVSLSEEDYQILAKKYQLDGKDHLAIKKALISELEQLTSKDNS